MTPLNDEILVAMADGALTAEERLAAERLLTADARARRLLLLLRLSAMAIRESFSDRELGEVPERLHRIVAADAARPVAAVARLRRLGAGWRLWIAAPAAAFALGILVAVAVSPAHVQTAHGEQVGLGTVARGSELAATLERFHAPQFTPASGAAGRFVVAASMRDRFGNACHEVDAAAAAETDGSVADLIVVCRTGDGGWSVVGAVAASTRVTAPYVTEDGSARSALSGILAMIGAQHRSGAAEKESGTQ